jgi:hypothetical protein
MVGFGNNFSVTFNQVMISSFSKKLLLLFAIGILVPVLFACQGTPSPASPVSVRTNTPVPATATKLPPTLTASPLPTETPVIPTETPRPTATPRPTPRGPLTWEQEARLYETSLKFVAENEEDATTIVRDQIDYLESISEHPSLVCGPLSAVILRDAGLLPPDVDLHGFWLLDPRLRPSQIVLETYFPPERYEWHQFETGTHKFDFNAFPLLPGDFLYLYAGINGTFEHILTVTRVDEVGRAYTVSNLNTENGFVIRELMLYDPNDPGAGQFYDWMNRDINGWLGMTGDGGFDLWRPIAPVQDYDKP